MSKRAKIIVGVFAGVVIVALLMRRRTELQVAQKQGQTAATTRPPTAFAALFAAVGSIPGLAAKSAGALLPQLPPVGGGTLAIIPQTGARPKPVTRGRRT